METFATRLFIISAVVIGGIVGLPIDDRPETRDSSIRENLHHRRYYDNDYNAKVVAERVGSWKPDDKVNAWELSGLFEGDIMIDPKNLTKNGLLDETTRWPGGVVPLKIIEEDFDTEKMDRIKTAIKEYHRRTCIRFRRHKEGDDDYVIIKGSESGCWSSVGRQGKGQELNLQKNGCTKHGTIVHELMHALGFYHQQSAANRDEFVKINWENIQPGKENNFNKYDVDTITDYGVSYDYGSVMHYSGFAFSKNGERTITPTEEGAEIGQRMELSEKDVTKLQEMYKEECGDRKPEGSGETSSEASFVDSLDWLID